MKKSAILAAAAMALAASEAHAQNLDAPIAIGEGLTLDPILAARLRYEMVDQANLPASADAATARVRIGALEVQNVSRQGVTQYFSNCVGTFLPFHRENRVLLTPTLSIDGSRSRNTPGMTHKVTGSKVIKLS
jgi:hypothetical protein